MIGKAEFSSQVGAYLTALWPAFELTLPQAEVWHDALKYFDVFTVREAVGRVYAASRYKEPRLAEVLDACRQLRRGERKHEVFTAAEEPGLREKCDAQHAETLRALAGYTRQDLEDAKAYILEREPELGQFRSLPADGQMWPRLIETRMVEKRVTVFPPGMAPRQVPVDEWWAQPRKLGPLANAMEVSQ